MPLSSNLTTNRKTPFRPKTIMPIRTADRWIFRRQSPLTQIFVGGCLLSWVVFLLSLVQMVHQQPVYSPTQEHQAFAPRKRKRSSHSLRHRRRDYAEERPSWLSSNDDDDNQCRLYLAPSSVPDKAGRPVGFGIFTTKDLPKGSYIMPRGEGPNIAITDFVEHANGNRPVWAQNIFLYPCSGFNAETQHPRPEKRNCFESLMNLGALGNFHPYLKNVMMDDNDRYRDDLLSRYSDPGAGAFSYNMGKKWYTMRDVRKGEELFDDYGESWFMHQLGEVGKTIPVRDHYLLAATYVWQYIRQAKKQDNDKHTNGISSETWKALFREVRSASDRASMLIPNITEVRQIANEVHSKVDVEMALARRTVIPRSIEWIEEHGRCLDNIVPGVSTIPQAGQGAFAARKIEKGTVVIPMPTLLQVPDKSTLNMYELELKKNEGRVVLERTGSRPTSKQLILNYCFGHEESSMVLCPATNGNLINHCSTRHEGCGKQGPNAEIRWATEFDPETEVWLDKYIDEISKLVDSGRRGLSFEIVALRDIQPGEEIFIDYGPVWENAWESHLRDWTSSDYETGFIPIAIMNRNIDEYLKTEDELEKEGYPSGARLACFHRGFYHPCTVLKRLPYTEPRRAFERPPQRLPVYLVRLEPLELEGKWEFRYHWDYGREKSIELTLTSRDMRFFHGAYSSDAYLPGTFRHSIGVPDHMWPEHWKNAKKDAKI